MDIMRKLVVVAVLLAGCDHVELDPGYVFGDGSGEVKVDGGGPVAPDLGDRPDLAVVADLASEDGSEADLAAADLVVAMDLADGAVEDGGDMAGMVIVMPDLAALPDLAMPRDFAVPRDMATPPDLVKLPDLAVPPDLVRLPDLVPLASCNDGVKNQDESDTDCGGSCGATCMNGQACNAPADCLSGGCAGFPGAQHCVPQTSAFYRVDGAGTAAILRCNNIAGGNPFDQQVVVGQVVRVDSARDCFFVTGGGQFAMGTMGQVCGWDGVCRAFCPNFNNNPGVPGFWVSVPGKCTL